MSILRGFGMKLGRNVAFMTYNHIVKFHCFRMFRNVFMNFFMFPTWFFCKRGDLNENGFLITVSRG